VYKRQPVFGRPIIATKPALKLLTPLFSHLLLISIAMEL
jgi:hypothetical protein